MKDWRKVPIASGVTVACVGVGWILSVVDFWSIVVAFCILAGLTLWLVSSVNGIARALTPKG